MSEIKDLGYYGEMYVLFYLSKLGIKAVDLPDFCEYDILTDSNIRIEVKTSSVVKTSDRKDGKFYPREIWQFLNYARKTRYLKNKTLKYEISERDRKCDFFILICLDEEKEVETEYIVPKEIIGKTQAITIPRVPKRRKTFKLDGFEKRWDLLLK